MRAAVVAERRRASTRRTRRSRRASRRWPAGARRRASRRSSPTSAATAARSAVAVVDYGVKRSILRRARRAGRGGRRSSRTTSTPTRSPASTASLLANGPGDPEPLDRRGRRRCAELLGRVPVFGVCLGHQLLALATGLETFKLRFGHRGANHPVLERATGRVLVTQPEPRLRRRAERRTERDARLALRRHRRGARLPRARAPRSVQFHPEARPGPARRAADPRPTGSRRCALPRRDDIQLDLPDRLGPDRDRPGLRVRLRRLPGAEGAARGGLPRRSSSTRTRRRS